MKPDSIDWPTIIASGVKQYGMMMQFADKLYTFDFESIYGRYADAINTEPNNLTDFEKRQAMLNAILEQA